MVTGRLFKRKRRSEIRLYNKSNGTLLKSRVTACNHPLYVSKRSIVACKFSGTKEQSLVYNCTKCKVTTVYESNVKRIAPKNQQKFKGSAKYILCNGPEGTVLAVNRFEWGIKLLGLKGAEYQFSSLEVTNFDKDGLVATKAVCYAPCCDTIASVVQVNNGNSIFSDIWGISLTTGRLIWTFSKQRDVAVDHDFRPRDICYTGQGLVCVANTDNVLLVDPIDGTRVQLFPVFVF